MSPAPYAPRLERLYHLRDRIEREIAEEERRLGRVDVARRKSFPGQGSRPRKRPVSTFVPPAPPDVVRAWAREQGIPVGTHGRIAHDVYHAWAKAHPAEA